VKDLTELTLEDYETRKEEWSMLYDHLEVRKCFFCGEWFKANKRFKQMYCSERCKTQTHAMLEQLRRANQKPVQHDWVLDMETMMWKNLKSGEVEVDGED